MSAPFLGMRGTGDFTVNGQRPENWREMILYLYPNGKAPLTALMAMMKSEKTDDPIYHWFEQEFPDQRGAITAADKTSNSFGAPMDNDKTAGQSIWLKMAEASAKQFKAGHTVLVANSGYLLKKATGIVAADATLNGADSYIQVTMTSTYDWSDNGSAAPDVVWIIGTAYSEGATSSTGVVYDPTEISNYTQIFRTTLDMTRTAKRTRLRTGDQVKEAKRQALELHSIEMEKAFFFNGAKYATTGSNGKPLRLTAGIRGFLSTNVSDFTKESGTATWADAGQDWFEDLLEQLFRYGSEEKIAYCGNGAIQGINALVKADATMNIQPMITSYGIKVMQWVTPFGTLNLKSHPLLTQEATTRNSMIILDPKFLTYRYIDDTAYKPAIQANDLDGEKSEYLTECGLEVHFEKAHAWLEGVGLNNP